MLTLAQKAAVWDRSEIEMTPAERAYVQETLEQRIMEEQQNRIDDWRFKRLTPNLHMPPYTAKQNELHIALTIPKPISVEIHNWAEEQKWPEGTELEPIEEYHITMLYASEGHDRKGDLRIDHKSHAVSIKDIKAFPSKEKGEGKDAIVLTVDSETAHLHHKELADNAEAAGIEISPFSFEDFKPHITIAYGKLPAGLKPPKLTFETAESSVSEPREESPKDADEKRDTKYKAHDRKSSNEFMFIDPVDDFVFIEPVPKPITHNVIVAHAPYEAELLKFAREWDEDKEDKLPGYFHAAPTEDRARIFQHGLQPSTPLHNPAWDRFHDDFDFEHQPTGVYVAEAPEGVISSRPDMDVWYIDPDYVHNVQSDPHSNAWSIIPHVVPSEVLTLYEPYENKVEWPVKNGESAFDRWLREYNVQHGHLLQPEWKIGQPTSKVADSWNPKDQWPNALRERNGEPVDADCTCKDGRKLDCPVHGMHPILPTYDDSLEFRDPSSPVGYDYHTEAPRTWMRAETNFHFGKPNSKLWLDDTRKPPANDDWDWAKNVKEAQHLLQHDNRKYKVMSLDHDLGMVKYEGKVVVNPDALSGGDFILWLIEHGDGKHLPKQVILHTHNHAAVELMYNSLKDHVKHIKIERAPDDLEEEWARAFKVHEPSEIEKEEVHLPERLASHQLAWLPHSGLPGKGLVTPDGSVHTWPTDGDGAPHHAEYVDRYQPYQLNEGTAHFFKIRPRGGLDTQSYDISPEIITHIIRTVPSLKAGEHTDWHFGADNWDTREYADSRMMPPTTMQEPVQGNPHPESGICTCKAIGDRLPDKLHCPVHGMYPDETAKSYDHSWSIPENAPVGYPQDQPRSYQVNTGSITSARGTVGIDNEHTVDPRRNLENRSNYYNTESNGESDKRDAKQSAYDGREGDQDEGVGIDHEYSLACDCPACQERREHSWHFQGPGTSEEGWGGLPRAEGAVEDEAEHEDDLEGDEVAMPKPPLEIRKKEKERRDLELVRS
jgi:2'-5' RNA ligase